MLVGSPGWGATIPTTLGSEPVPPSNKKSRLRNGTNSNNNLDLVRAVSPSPTALQESEILTTVNSKGQKKFQCMFCGILLSTKNYLKNHVNAVHTKSRVYPCELCERFFYSAGALRIHKLRHHWANSKKHFCPHCQEAFLLPVELRRHVVKKHGDEEVAAGSGGADSEGEKNLTIENAHQIQVSSSLYNTYVAF